MERGTARTAEDHQIPFRNIPRNSPIDLIKAGTVWREAFEHALHFFILRATTALVPGDQPGERLFHGGRSAVWHGRIRRPKANGGRVQYLAWAGGVVRGDHRTPVFVHGHHEGVDGPRRLLEKEIGAIVHDHHLGDWPVEWRIGGGIQLKRGAVSYTWARTYNLGRHDVRGCKHCDCPRLDAADNCGFTL